MFEAMHPHRVDAYSLLPIINFDKLCGVDYLVELRDANKRWEPLLLSSDEEPWRWYERVKTYMLVFKRVGRELIDKLELARDLMLRHGVASSELGIGEARKWVVRVLKPRKSLRRVGARVLLVEEYEYSEYESSNIEDVMAVVRSVLEGREVVSIQIDGVGW